MDQGWKKFERQVARDFGGQRTGPRGYGLPDVKGIPLAIECKHVSKLTLRSDWLHQAETNAKGTPWLLVMREKPGRGKKARTLVVMDYQQFLDLYRGMGQDDCTGDTDDRGLQEG